MYCQTVLSTCTVWPISSWQVRLFLTLLATIVQGQTNEDSSNDVKWNYDANSVHGPKHWQKQYKYCGGSSQSPISLTSDDAQYVPELDPVRFINYSNPVIGLEIKNVGSNVLVALQKRHANTVLRISHSTLDGSYRLEQLHFHWGTELADGSEHAVNGRRYPAELHLVHAKENSSSNKFAVISILIEISEHDNVELNKITSSLKLVKFKDLKLVLPEMFTVESLLPSELVSFYWYKGSLTTPNCAEDVIWIVYNNTISMSLSQLNQFRTQIHTTSAGDNHSNNGSLLSHNNRPLQQNGERTVIRTFNTLDNNQDNSTIKNMSSYKLILSSRLINVWILIVLIISYESQS